jgi:hypothetical protein
LVVRVAGRNGCGDVPACVLLVEHPATGMSGCRRDNLERWNPLPDDARA